MSSIGIALIALICSFGGAWVGVLLRERLPEAHLSPETSEVVKLGTGLVGTMAALVLGLLVASAATEFNAEATGLQTLATDFILLVSWSSCSGWRRSSWASACSRRAMPRYSRCSS